MCHTTESLLGKIAIVTGGSSGIGYETAKQLAYKKARVIIASRNETKLIEARDRIRTTTGNTNVDYRKLDLSSLRSVREFVTETISNEESVNILVNNAGAVGLPDKITNDGLLLTMQVNYFGTFLLTYLLLPLLKASSPSRIINLSASSIYVGDLDFDRWNHIDTYSPVNALANSKLALTLFTSELSRRLNGTNVTANNVDPFVVSETGILNNLTRFIQLIAEPLIKLLGQRKQDVAKQIYYLVAEPSLKNVTGLYFKFCTEWVNHWLASDEVFTRVLWDKSKEAVKITDEENWEDRSVFEHKKLVLGK